MIQAGCRPQTLNQFFSPAGKAKGGRALGEGQNGVSANISLYIYIYIYMKRERERQIEIDLEIDRDR